MEREKQKRRVVALLLALCVMAVLLLSAFFVITHASHVCTGSDCKVCHELENCLATARQVSWSAGNTLFHTFGALLLLLCLFLPAAVLRRCPDTLVALHVRLNN